MTHRDRQSASYWDRSWTADDPIFSDDAVLAWAYRAAEWVIAVVGPLFWMFLAAGFLAAGLASP